MSERRITRRSLADRRTGETDWDRLRALRDEEVEAAAADDPDAPLWTDEELAAVELVLPPTEAKVAVSIRLDADVLEHFKASGRGYQSRINAVLRAYVRSRRLKKP